MYHDEEYYEIEYFDDEDYEEAKRKDAAELNRQTIQHLENRYGCSFPEFILLAQSYEQMTDLYIWSAALRNLAKTEEKIYS